MAIDMTMLYTVKNPVVLGDVYKHVPEIRFCGT